MRKTCSDVKTSFIILEATWSIKSFSHYARGTKGFKITLKTAFTSLNHHSSSHNNLLDLVLLSMEVEKRFSVVKISNRARWMTSSLLLCSQHPLQCLFVSRTLVRILPELETMSWSRRAFGRERRASCHRPANDELLTSSHQLLTAYLMNGSCDYSASH